MFHFNLSRVRWTNGGWLLLATFVGLSLNASGQATFSVLNYGAVADGVLRTDGAMSAGSFILNSASGTFSSSDVGKYIQVIGAGSGGTSHTDGFISSGSNTLTSPSGSFQAADIGRGIVVLGAGLAGTPLVTTIQSFISPNSVLLSAPAQSVQTAAPYYYGAMTLESTIQSVQSSTSIILASPAAAPVSGATYAYGTDDHSAFQSALDAAGQAGGGTVTAPSPTSCPIAAVCGYVLGVSNQMTATLPGSIKIRYNNVSLSGSAPQTNLFCRGAWANYSNSAAYPGQIAEIRGRASRSATTEARMERQARRSRTAPYRICTCTE